MTFPCRICGQSQLIQILDLGFAPTSNSLLIRENLYKKESYFPLKLLFCNFCKLAQTQDFHTSKEIFSQSYPYLSSTSKSWLEHSNDLVQHLIKKLDINKSTTVVEIASNDGYLLEILTSYGIPCYGIEPTKIPFNISVSKGHRVFQEFLNLHTAKKILQETGFADVVIANNVFAHIPDLLEFTESAISLLSNNGIIVLEVQYFPKLIENNLFDTIYHEHFSYFSLKALNSLFLKFDMEIFDLDFHETHGGSIRVYVQKNKNHSKSKLNLSQILLREENILKLEYLNEFQSKVSKHRDEVRNFFVNIKKSYELIVGIGAAAKGNTFLNYCGLTTEDMSYILDSADSKHGKYMPGSHIPILPMNSDNLTDNSAYVILAWNLTKEFLDIMQRSNKIKNCPIFTLLPKISKI